jgi:hypothetical protein
MPKTKPGSSFWAVSVVVLSLLLFFVSVPHTLEDFALGEPLKNGVPAPVLSFVVAGLIALQGLGLFLVGRRDRRGYLIHAGLGIVWPLAAGLAQLPVILTSTDYRSGFISILYVVGMIAIGILLMLVSLREYFVNRTSAHRIEEK